MARSVGIDLGTAWCSAAVLEAGRPVVVPVDAEELHLPAAFSLKEARSSVAFGREALTSEVDEPRRVVRGPRRHLGDAAWTARVAGHRLLAPTAAAVLLRHLGRSTEAYLADDVSSAVVNVPTMANEAEREATVEAASIAGLLVPRLVSDTTATAITLAFQDRVEQSVLVVDLGAGSLSVGLFEIGDGVIEAKAVSGDSHLGGDDWDDLIVDWLATEVWRGALGSGAQDPMTRLRLRRAAARARVELSESEAAVVRLSEADGVRELSAQLVRGRFEHLAGDLTRRVGAAVNDCLEQSESGPVDRVVLTGGMTRTPAVTALVSSLASRVPERTSGDGLTVAQGAAILAGVLQGEVKDVLTLDVTPLSLGLETKGGVMTVLVPRNTTLPTTREEVFTTADDEQASVMIQVYEGESTVAAENHSVGSFELTGIPPAPRNVPQIAVTFDLDANGHLHTRARDTVTDASVSARVTARARLSDAQLSAAENEVMELVDPYADDRPEVVDEPEVVDQPMDHPAQQVVPATAASPSGATTNGIFISYRRADTAGAAGRLYDRLIDTFDPSSVFMDVDSVEPGTDFFEVIDANMARCQILLVLIGGRWVTMEDTRGARRLDDPDDIVRLEVQAGLDRGIRVIPVLVDEAPMPYRDELPEALAPLARRNATRLRHESFRSDAARIVGTLQTILSRP